MKRPALRNVTRTKKTPLAYVFSAIRADGKSVTVTVPIDREGA